MLAWIRICSVFRGGDGHCGIVSVVSHINLVLVLQDEDKPIVDSDDDALKKSLVVARVTV